MAETLLLNWWGYVNSFMELMEQLIGINMELAIMINVLIVWHIVVMRHLQFRMFFQVQSKLLKLHLKDQNLNGSGD